MAQLSQSETIIACASAVDSDKWINFFQSIFTHVASIYANLLEQKKGFA